MRAQKKAPGKAVSQGGRGQQPFPGAIGHTSRSRVPGVPASTRHGTHTQFESEPPTSLQAAVRFVVRRNTVVAVFPGADLPTWFDCSLHEALSQPPSLALGRAHEMRRIWHFVLSVKAGFLRPRKFQDSGGTTSVATGSDVANRNWTGPLLSAMADRKSFGVRTARPST